MKARQAVLASLALAGLLGLTGCVVALGNSDGKRVSSPTLGQELIDLKEARDAGAISDSEYRMQRSKLLGHSED